MALTTRIDLDIPQGSTYIHTFTYLDTDDVPINLTGYTARMQMRRSVNSAEILHSATTENGGISITPVDGVIELRIDSTDTEAFDFAYAVYDLEIIAPDASVTRLVKGKVKVDPEVTR